MGKGGKMKTKREILRHIAKYGNCAGIKCFDCPYYESFSYCPNSGITKRIGAMAILRMFPEKKKPTLEIGTKIKFSDGRIATLVKIEPEVEYLAIYYQLDFGSYYRSIDYLIGKTWEVVE
jgi:hypothetical protein